MPKPTAYYVRRNTDGNVTAVARSYWPNSTDTEVFHGDGEGWKDRDMLLRLMDEPDWVMTDADEALRLVDELAA